MIFKSVDFVISVASERSLHESKVPEIAVAGKSNVGKSSFINMLAGRKKLAKVSSEPGRTRLINYFDFDKRFMLVDLPGYGFAKAPQEEKKKWGQLIEGYLHGSRDLKRVLLLLDCRHEPTEDDLLMIHYLYFYAIPFWVVLTKADKLSKAQLQKCKRVILERIKLTENDIFVTSSVTAFGREEILNAVERLVADSSEEM